MNSKVPTNLLAKFLTNDAISFADLDTGTQSKTSSSQGFQC